MNEVCKVWQPTLQGLSHIFTSHVLRLSKVSMQDIRFTWAVRLIHIPPDVTFVWNVFVMIGRLECTAHIFPITVNDITYHIVFLYQYEIWCTISWNTVQDCNGLDYWSSPNAYSHSVVINNFTPSIINFYNNPAYVFTVIHLNKAALNTIYVYVINRIYYWCDKMNFDGLQSVL